MRVRRIAHGAARRYHSRMHARLPKRETLTVAVVVTVWALIVASVVVLDKNHYGWIALMIYGAVYCILVRIDGRFQRNARSRASEHGSRTVP